MSQADYVAKLPRRVKLRETVEKYWLDEPHKPPGSLDSSLKKHTTLLNRLKTLLLVGPAEALIKEIDGLALTKYLEEIAGAVVEGASKGKGDAEVAVDIIVHLHTRLSPDFLPLLLPPLLALLAPPASTTASAKDVDSKDKEKEEKERLAKQRPILRIVGELALVHAWPEGVKKGVEEVLKILKALMANDPTYVNLPLVATFVKHFDRAYLGAAQNQNGQADADAADGGGSDASAAVEELVPVDVQKTFHALFVGYFNSASKTLVKGQVKLLEQDKKNHEAYIKFGEIFDDRQHAYERMTKAVERLTVGVQSLADLLNLSMPTLPTAATLSKGGLQIVETASSFTVREDSQGVGIWSDEEERKFYEDIPDLKDFVPFGLLGVKVKKEEVKGEKAGSASMQKAPSKEGEVETQPDADTEMEAEKERLEREKVDQDIKRQLEQMSLEPTLANGDPDEAKAAGDAQPTEILAGRIHEEDAPRQEMVDTGVVGEEEGLQSGPAARLTALFAALPEAVNREMVDKLAVEFAFLNSKAARKRLVKFLTAVPRDRTDLLPHYSRFIAILDRYMPDVGEGVVDALEEELRYLQRKKAVRELDSTRLKNVRFYGELAKFRVTKPYAILHVLKVFLDDFKANIENMSNLLENCGRFLLRFEGTAETAKSMIELMRRKQGTTHLDHRYHVMLENAFYHCNPPERVLREVVELPPMLAFIQHLLHDVLLKRTLDKVLKLLRKLHWEDPEVYDYILRSFTEVWDLKFGNIPFVAALVYDLTRYHPDFQMAVVDQVMEDIRIGMEENIFKFNQRRISSIKYLGELYMYRVVGANVIFETLWSLISFGHGDGLPVPGRDGPLDAVDDFFRVRLVCTLLDTCGVCFDRGSQKRKLDHFLTVFQLYIVCKVEIPMDVEFMLTDTLDLLRPKTPRLQTFAEAAAAVDALLAAQTGETVNDSASDASDGEEEGGRGAAEDEDDEDEEEAAQPPVEVGRIDDDEEEADEVVLIRQGAATQDTEVDKEFQADFDREFAKMLADTTDARRGDRKNAPPIFDTAVPHISRRTGVTDDGPAPIHAFGDRVGAKGVEKKEDLGKMQFSLLAKKGNKQQIREIEIPMDSAIAINSRTYQLQNKAEQEQLKRLVLQNERRQGQSEMQAFQDDMRSRGIRTRFVGT